MKYYKVKFDSQFCGFDKQFVVAGENITSEEVESYIQDDYEEFVYEIESDDRCVDQDIDEDEYYDICEQIESECTYSIQEIEDDEAHLYQIYIINK